MSSIHPVLQEADKLLAKGEPFVLATVVRTKGSTPQKPGAKLLVRRDGTAVGTLGGGCIEADVWAEAKTILERDAGAQLRRFVLNEEIAAKDGLVCGGNMDILIDPLAARPQEAPYLHEIVAACEGKGDRVLATLVEPGASGGKAGDKLFVREDGSTEGSLGSAALDELAIETTREVMPRGQIRWIEGQDGAKVFVEGFTVPMTVVIAGGGHVGKAVYTVAAFAGMKVIMIDDRPAFANGERFPLAEQVIVAPFDEGIRSLDLGPTHCVLVATRGHKLDDVALLAAAQSNAGYVGLLGSRRKAVMIFRDLLRQGVSQERVASIRAPVGLDLGGRTPEEIAVSIVAEIIAHKHGRTGKPMTLEEKVLEKAKTLAAKPPARPRTPAPA
jgi:xanthine dehydrogenase accessory factor